MSNLNTSSFKIMILNLAWALHTGQLYSPHPIHSSILTPICPLHLGHICSPLLLLFSMSYHGFHSPSPWNSITCHHSKPSSSLCLKSLHSASLPNPITSGALMLRGADLPCVALYSQEVHSHGLKTGISSNSSDLLGENSTWTPAEKKGSTFPQVHHTVVYLMDRQSWKDSRNSEITLRFQ